MIEAKGLGGTVTFDGRMVRIERTGLFARNTVGKGEKSFPLVAIGGIRFKAATWLNNGYIKFVVMGGADKGSIVGRQYLDAAVNENAVVFRRRDNEAFVALQRAIETALAGGALTAGYWDGRG